MLQDGLLIGNAPDFALSLKGEELFHKVSVAVWRQGVQESSVPLAERGLSMLRKKVLEIVMAKSDYGKLAPGVSDFAICEVPERSLKITVNIIWNKRLSPESIEAILRIYVSVFFPESGTAKVAGNTSEGGENSKQEV